MTLDPDEFREKLETGRHAVAERLRCLADEIETLPLADAAEVLSWITGQIEQLLRDAERIVRAR